MLRRTSDMCTKITHNLVLDPEEHLDNPQDLIYQCARSPNVNVTFWNLVLEVGVNPLAELTFLSQGT